MNARAIAAVVRRDLTVIRSSKSVLLPMIFVPLIIVIVVPSAAGLIAYLPLDEHELEGVAGLLSELPRTVRSDLDGGGAALVAEFVVTYLAAPLYLLVPLVVAQVIAADSIAGERDRGTLEGVLLTPVSDRELLAAKLLAAWIPATLVGLGGGVVYSIVADVTLWPAVHHLVLPNVTWVLLVVWLAPALSAAALAVTVLISARARTFQGAQQIAGFCTLPVVFLLVSQVNGLLLLGSWLVLAAGALLWAIAACLVFLGARTITRARLGARLG